MKQRIIIGFFVAAIICSCGKEEGVDRYSKDIVGQYMCETAVWMGANDIDINGDSAAGKDLFLEFYGIDEAFEALANTVMRVISVSSYDVYSDKIFWHFPLQGLNYDKENNTYSLGTTDFYGLFAFSYSINSNGVITFSQPEAYAIDSSAMLMPESRDITINGMGNNRFDMTIESQFFDFKTNTVVSGPVHYSFRRYYSDPNICNIDTFIPIYR